PHGNKNSPEPSHSRGRQCTYSIRNNEPDWLRPVRESSWLNTNTLMKNKNSILKQVVALGCSLVVWLPTAGRAATTNSGYIQVNLVSDSTNAPRTDARLLNPWGIVVGPGLVWVNNNNSSLKTISS